MGTDDKVHISCQANPEKEIIAGGPEMLAKAVFRVDEHIKNRSNYYACL